MRSDWIETDKVKVILALLTAENQLAIEMSLRYGMRIGDVLATRTEDVKNGRWTYKEQKTGKSRRITLNDLYRQRLLRISGELYVFTHRYDNTKHRTRQAVYKDIKKAAKAIGVKQNFSCHSARKVYAVGLYNRTGKDLCRCRKLLNHSSEAVTQIYVLSDLLSKKTM